MVRRHSYTLMGAIALYASTALLANAEEKITVVSYGGQLTVSQTKAFYEPFTAKTGIKIDPVTFSGGLAEVNAQVLAGNVTWDVVDLEMADAIKGCNEGLFERIDPATLPAAPDGTPAQDDFLAGTLHECAVPTVVWSTIYAYDESKIGTTKPVTSADFFDTERWPGRRGMRRAPRGNLEFALIADGVNPAEVYDVLSTPEGVDRAFAKLDTVKKDVVWWEAGSQPPQLLADGEVVMTTAYNGRIFNAAIDEKKPFKIVWDGQVYDVNIFAIPKGTAKHEAALEFIAFATGTQPLADQAKWIPYGPARTSSNAFIGKNASGEVDLAPHLPTTADNRKNALQLDPEWWGDHEDQLSERFNSWLLKK